MLSCFGCGIIDSGSNESKSYDVVSNYFESVTFKKSIINSIGVNGHSGSGTSYLVEFYSSCSISLYEFSVVANLYSEDHIILDSFEETYTKNISAGNQIKFSKNISSDTYSKLETIKVLISGKSHEKPTQKNIVTQKATEATTEREVSYRVTFVYNNGEANRIISVKKGQTIQTPNDPQKDKYLFKGWYTDKSLTSRYDFSKSIYSDFTIYAAYELDAKKITNEISRDQMRGIVKIVNKCYNTSVLGRETESITHQGSGVCFHIQNGYYYILTNFHVADKGSYKNQTYTIQDYQGNTYEGFLFRSADKSFSALADSYDLACIYFKANSSNVVALNIASSNPKIGEDTVSLGNPDGQTNFITYGKILKYEKITVSNSSADVQFDVIAHDAYINGGSSGGPILNTKYQVVGLNYAGSNSQNVTRSYAIPVEKIREFLKEYVYS